MNTPNIKVDKALILYNYELVRNNHMPFNITYLKETYELIKNNKEYIEECEILEEIFKMLDNK